DRFEVLEARQARDRVGAARETGNVRAHADRIARERRLAHAEAEAPRRRPLLNQVVARRAARIRELREGDLADPDRAVLTAVRQLDLDRLRALDGGEQLVDPVMLAPIALEHVPALAEHVPRAITGQRLERGVDINDRKRR